MTTTVSISLDVPDLESGVAFYSRVFGFEKKSAPAPGVVVLGGLNVTLCLMQKRAGSRPTPQATVTRDYARHWTAVHLDFHVDDLAAAVDAALAAGATLEQRFDHAGHGGAAFMADPFGHGFCLIERRAPPAAG